MAKSCFTTSDWVSADTECVFQEDTPCWSIIANGITIVDGTEDNHPFPMIDFATQLETIWNLLMTVSLLGPLEKAFRKQTLKDEYLDQTRDEKHRERFEDAWNDLEPSDQLTMLNESEGLPDPMTLSPTAVIEMIRKRHIPSLRRACEEQMYNEHSLNDRI